MDKLIKLVEQWANDKGILHHKNARKQFEKVVEEVYEFKSEWDIYDFLKEYQNKSKVDTSVRRAEKWESMQLEMGDILVTLIILCADLGLNLNECLEMAYNKIKDRKGKVVNGKFVKEEDL